MLMNDDKDVTNGQDNIDHNDEAHDSPDNFSNIVANGSESEDDYEHDNNLDGSAVDNEAVDNEDANALDTDESNSGIIEESVGADEDETVDEDSLNDQEVNGETSDDEVLSDTEESELVDKKPLHVNDGVKKGSKVRKRVVATAAGIGILGGLSVVSYFGYHWYQDRDNVEVPSAVSYVEYGTDSSDTVLCADFVKASLRCEVNWTTNENADRGSLLEQSVIQGESVDPNTKVVLTYSSGPAESEFPNLTGQDLEDSKELLYEMGITVSETSEVEGDGIPSGRIVSSSIDPGAVVENGSDVNLKISDGAIEIPDWSGKSRDFVEADAQNYGLTVEFVEEASEDEAPGVVLSQSPAAGEVVEDGNVTVNIAKAPEVEEVNVPDVLGMGTEEAQSRLAVEGFTNIKIVLVNSSTVDSPQVTEIVPGVGSSASTDSQLVVIVSQPEEAAAEEDTSTEE